MNIRMNSLIVIKKTREGEMKLKKISTTWEKLMNFFPNEVSYVYSSNHAHELSSSILSWLTS